MKRNRKMLSIGLTALVIALVAFGMASCASTGQFMPLSSGETVIGTVQADFTARKTLGGRDAINTQAYIKLLEAAQRQYARDSVQIDIRDIVWVSGKDVDETNTEYAASGKVVRLP
jgi:hypothetical protein